MFVEAHTVGQDDWTTLPDLNGHTSQDTGLSCPFWLDAAPVPRALPDRQRRRHVLADRHHGRLVGGERRQRRLRAVGGRPVRLRRQRRRGVDQLRQRRRRAAGRASFVDDIVVSTGAGTTSFEDDGDDARRLDRPGRARRQRAQPQRLDRRHGGRRAADRSATIVEGSFARQARDHRLPGGHCSGAYPFSAAGGIVDDVDEFGFALENQTRPIYSKAFFGDPLSGDSVVVHELAHQWFGDSLAVATVAAHLAQRGLRHLRRVAVERARRARHRPGDLRLLLRRASRPTTRSGR